MGYDFSSVLEYVLGGVGDGIVRYGWFYSENVGFEQLRYGYSGLLRQIDGALVHVDVFYVFVREVDVGVICLVFSLGDESSG